MDIDEGVGEGPDERGVWRTTDLYLDITVRTGRDLEVLDTDEVLAAMQAGLIDHPTAVRAFERTHRAVEGIARAGYDVDKWLVGQGVPVTWTPTSK